MRARNIKPGFFKNDDLADLPPFTRLLFIGLWCMADRLGRLEDRPRKIKGEIFPYDDVDVNTALQSLHDSGMVLRYEVDGARYVQVVNFLKHQKPHVNEVGSDIPPPRESKSTTKDEQEYNQGSAEEQPKNQALGPDSGSPRTDSPIPDSSDSGSPIPDSQAEAEAEEPRSAGCPQDVRRTSDPQKPDGNALHGVTCNTPDPYNAFGYDAPDLPTPDSLEAYISNYLPGMTSGNWDQLAAFLRDDGVDDAIVKYAIDEACAQNKCSWAYVRSILDRWVKLNITTVAGARLAQEQFKAAKQAGQGAPPGRYDKPKRTGPADNEFM